MHFGGRHSRTHQPPNPQALHDLRDLDPELAWLESPPAVLILTVHTERMTMNKYITLQEAAKVTPMPVSQCTIWRWCVKGFYISAIKQLVRLQYVCVGRKMFTTEQWLEEFIVNLSAAKELARQARRKPGKLERLLEVYHAEAILRRAGI